MGERLGAAKDILTGSQPGMSTGSGVGGMGQGTSSFGQRLGEAKDIITGSN